MIKLLEKYFLILTIMAKSKKKKKHKFTISNKKYKRLLSQRKAKKKMTLRNKKVLDKMLYVKYCRCLKAFEAKGKENLGYPVCMNTIYKVRNIKPPKNASRRCKELYNKNIVL